MVSSGDKTGVQSFSSTHVGAGQSEWIERCRTSILERDPLLSADDVLDLALHPLGSSELPTSDARTSRGPPVLRRTELDVVAGPPAPSEVVNRRVATQRARLALRARYRSLSVAGAGEARSGHRSPDELTLESDHQEIALSAFFAMAWRTLLHRGARQSARLQAPQCTMVCSAHSNLDRARKEDMERL